MKCCIIKTLSQEKLHDSDNTVSDEPSAYQFVAAVRVNNPQLPIYYIGITLSPRRWEIWPHAQATNAIIEDYSQRTDGFFYIDTGAAFIDAQGKPDKDKYTFDSLHLSDEGYRQWAAIIRPRLLEDLRAILNGVYMKQLSMYQYLAWLLICSMLLGSSAYAQDRPNVVIFVADDLGFADVGFRGSKLKRPT